MRATDIIRDLLDLIDGIDHTAETIPEPTAEIELIVPAQMVPSDTNHFTQIADLITQANLPGYSNEPNERYADIDSVTVNAGGGLNGPKHPADIKGEHPSLYPGTVYGA